MEKRYVQPWANAQLNSYQPVKLTAKGKLGWRFVFNESLQHRSKFVHLVDEKRALIDGWSDFYALDIANKKVIYFSGKADGTFLTVLDGQEFLYSRTGLYSRLEFDQLKKLDLDSLKYFRVPGVGETWFYLSFFVPKKDSFIGGTQTFGNPAHNRKYIGLYERLYKDAARDDSDAGLWYLELDGEFPFPAVSKDLRIVAAQTASTENTLRIVNEKGLVIKSLKSKDQPVTLSIGPDYLIYMVARREKKSFLEAYDFDFIKKWETEVDFGTTEEYLSGSETVEPLMPPLTGSNKVVFLVGISKVIAFKEGKKLWEFKTSVGLKERQGYSGWKTYDYVFNAATVSDDGKLLLVDNGSRIVSLDPSGKLLWEFKDKDGGIFTTPPVIDEKGKVYVASDKMIFKIE